MHPRRLLLHLRPLLSFIFDALCDGAVSRLGESAFVFLFTKCTDHRTRPRCACDFVALARSHTLLCRR